MNKLSFKAFMQYQNQWVATNPERSRVLAAASTLKEVVSKLGKLNSKNAVLTFITSLDKYISPYADTSV